MLGALRGPLHCGAAPGRRAEERGGIVGSTPHRHRAKGMRARRATLIRTGQRIESEAQRLGELYALARSLYPEGFPAEETRTLDALREHLSIAYVDRLRHEVASRLDLPLSVLSLDRFYVYGCGPIALHDDRHNYPGVYFAIVVAHSGRLGVVDAASTAVCHAPGEILLLDPYRKHALVREGLRARDHAYARTHAPVLAPEDQFMFLDFDIARRDLHQRFRAGR
jgi:hypothetical protein